MNYYVLPPASGEGAGGVVLVDDPQRVRRAKGCAAGRTVVPPLFGGENH